MQEQQTPNPQLSEDDVKLIKSLCDEQLLKAIRALFLGLSPTAEEKALVRSAFQSARLKQIFWQRFCPAIHKDAPIGSLQDVWLGVEEMVFGQNPTTIEQALRYKTDAIKLTRQALALLDDPDGTQIDVTFEPSPVVDPLGIWLLARNMFVRHVEKQLGYLKFIASQKEETPKERTDRVRRASAK